MNKNILKYENVFCLIIKLEKTIGTFWRILSVKNVRATKCVLAHHVSLCFNWVRYFFCLLLSDFQLLAR